MTTFAKRLRARRLELGLTQQRVADASGVNRTTITYYEDGKRDPNLATLIRMARILEVSIDWLAGLEENIGGEKPPIQIKRLGAKDSEQMQMLNEVFAVAFEEPETYLEKKPSERYLRTLLKKDHILVYVAMNGYQVVGGLVAYALEKFEQNRKEIYIYDLAVDESYRRQKIATRLIESLKEDARRLGAWVVFVQADKVDEPAVKLYESLGVREEVLHFDISLNDKKDSLV